MGQIGRNQFQSSEDAYFMVANPSDAANVPLNSDFEPMAYVIVKPDGTFAMTGNATPIYYNGDAPSNIVAWKVPLLVASYAAGDWQCVFQFSSEAGYSDESACITWGGWIDTVVNAAVQNLPGGDVYDSVDAIHVTTNTGGTLLVAAQNADAQSYRTQQTVAGDSTFDSGTGIVRVTSTGEEFTLADEAGVAVSSQALAVRRINSTLG